MKSSTLFGQLIQLSVGLAAPTQNLTAINTQYAPAWVPEPSGRGTWSLLYSCLFTLGLCVYTAIHVNIPARGEHSSRQWLRRMKWAFAAVFAPELGVFTAWQQWCWARRISAELSSLRLAKENRGKTSQDDSTTNLSQTSKMQSDAESNSPLRPSYSMTYGFYVVMGGLTVNVSDLHDVISTVTLTPAGVLHLARLGYFEDLSDEDIHDKSKADTLAKGLVFLQVTWMILQCISRKAVGYPLTALEVHTLVHAGCALIMYTLWFRKPLDVHEPTLIPTAGLEKQLALMLIRSPGFCRMPFRNVVMPNGYGPAAKDDKSDALPGEEETSEATYLAFCPPSSRGGSNELVIGKSCTLKQDKLADVVRFVAREGTGKGRDQCFQNPVKECTAAVEHYANRLQEDRAGNAAVEPSSAFLVVPPSGIRVAGTLTTGDFMANGIGPNAFVASKLAIRRPGRWPKFGQQVENVDEKPGDLSEQLYSELPLEHTRYVSNKEYYRLSISVSPKDIRRWDLAAAAFMEERSLFTHTFESLQGRAGSSQFLILRSKNFPTLSDVMAQFDFATVFDYDKKEADPLRGLSVVLMVFVLILLSILYGGVHLALWNYDFPTRVESLMWRVAAVDLLAVSMLVVVYFIAYAIYHHYKKHLHQERKAKHLESRKNGDEHRSQDTVRENNRDQSKAWKMVKYTGLFLVVLPASLIMAGAGWLFIPSRIYIIVESFISLRHVPIGVYDEVNWAQYIPHL